MDASSRWRLERLGDKEKQQEIIDKANKIVAKLETVLKKACAEDPQLNDLVDRLPTGATGMEILNQLYKVTRSSRRDSGSSRRSSNLPIRDDLPCLVRWLGTDHYNLLWTQMFESSDGSPAITSDDRVNHLNEVGRSVWARSSQILKPYPRCWTCRCLYCYLWSLEEGDDPRYTALVANRNAFCAEPILHSLCLAHELRSDLMPCPDFPTSAEPIFNVSEPPFEEDVLAEVRALRKEKAKLLGEAVGEVVGERLRRSRVNAEGSKLRADDKEDPVIGIEDLGLAFLSLQGALEERDE